MHLANVRSCLGVQKVPALFVLRYNKADCPGFAYFREYLPYFVTTFAI